MGPEEDKYKIPLFDGTNFSNWKFRMQVLLEEYGLEEFIEEPYTRKVNLLEECTRKEKEAKEKELAALKMKDRKCKSQIIQRIADSHLEYVKDAETSFDVWKLLNDTFERKGIASQLLLRKYLLTMKYNSSMESLEAHFLKFDRLIRELRSTGATLEETDVVCHLLLTMPSEYDVVVTALETISCDKLTISFVKNRLLDEQTKRRTNIHSNTKEFKSTEAFIVKNAKSSNPNVNVKQQSCNSKYKNHFKFKCYNCGLVGHKRSECTRKVTQQLDQRKFNSHQGNVAILQPGSGGGENDETAFMGNTDNQNGNVRTVILCLDSGASEHMVSDSSLLANLQRFDKPVKIKVAKNGETLESNHYGELHCTTLIGEKETKIKVNQVLFVPGLTVNLLSVPKLDSNGLQVLFEKGKAIISKNGKEVAIAHKVRKLYELVVYNFEHCNISSTESNTTLWHKRLGHISNTRLKSLKNLVDGINLPDKAELTDICKSCVEGKQTRQPHNQGRLLAKRPLQLIHSDLCGPINPQSYDGKKYFLTFIDDFTHFTAVYCLEAKSEVFHYFKIYEAMATAHFNLKVSRFRCDNGGEFISSEMKEYFEMQGIQFEFTIRYTPQQNGVAERMNRTILDKARSMMFDTSLNKTFWVDAVKTAVYIINRCPTSSLDNVVPAELWYGEKPNLRKLKVFGCIAHLHVPNQLIKGKLDKRSLQCIFIGYCTNGYKLWCPEEKKVISGRDVIFDESSFMIKKEIICTKYDRNLQDEPFIESDVEDSQTEKKNTTDEDFVEVRRSTRNRTKPKYLEDYLNLVFNAETYIEEVPENLNEIADREDKENWCRAVREEMDSLIENNTWTLTELPKGKRAIDCKWVFKIKRDEEGNIDRYKARLVAKGCSQKKGFDYNETYAPVARYTTVRTLLAVINKEELKAYQMDVKNAFLHGYIQEEIYMKQPEGFQDNPNLVCKLNRSLYGLKQAPRSWNTRLHEFLLKQEMVQSQHDKCLYVRNVNKKKTYILVYVDDLIIAGNDENMINGLKVSLSNEFSMKDLGELNNFLGIKIDRNANGMFLSQPAYLKSILNKFGMEDCKPVKTPMELKFVTNEESKEIIIDKKPYRELIGCLMYVMQITRPDLSFSVNYFSRFQSNATEEHWKGLKRILRYVKKTINEGLFYPKDSKESLTGYADSDWACDSDRKSTTGYVMQVFESTVSWATKKQTAVALSSTEAEYIALATAATEAVWLKNVLRDIGMNMSNSVVIYEDNQPCIHLLDKWVHRKLKHIDVKYNFVQDLHRTGVIEVKYIPSNDQKADILTKSVPYIRFEKLKTCLGISS